MSAQSDILYQQKVWLAVLHKLNGLRNQRGEKNGQNTCNQRKCGGGTDETLGTAVKVGTINVNGTTYDKYRIVKRHTVSYDSSGVYSVLHGLSYNGVLTCLASIKVSSNSNTCPLPYLSSSVEGSVRFIMTTSNFEVTCPNKNLNNGTLTVVVEYY